MRRPTASQAAPKGKWDCPDIDFKKDYPSLAEGMCDTWWEDGKRRTPWSMSVRFDGDAVQLSLNDKEIGQGAYTTAHSLLAALTLMEGALLAGTLEWRKWKK